MALVIVAPMPHACKTCNAPIEKKPGRGRWPRYCSDHRPVIRADDKLKRRPAERRVFYCLDCGVENLQPRRGRRRDRCKECGKRHQGHKNNAKQRLKRPTLHECRIAHCTICLNVFQRGPLQHRSTKYCDECRKTHDGNKKVCGCQHCGAKFRPKRYNRVTFCSRECSFANDRANRLPPEELKRRMEERQAASRAVLNPCQCKQCSATFTPKNSRQSLCSAECQTNWNREAARLSYQLNDARDRSPRPCGECGKLFAPEYGNKRRSFCSSDCCHKSSKRTTRKARKARKRVGTVEFVNPTKVFDRDGWRCQLCGCSTPRKYRGTYHPTAPELDHIIPLAAGGEHSYRNTQCACRECNGAKGAKPLGQMRLIA